MQKSIFTKFFRVTAVVFIAAILVLGSLFLPFSAQYFTSEKMNTLEKHATIARSVVLSNYQVSASGNQVTLNSGNIRTGFRMFADAVEGEIYITDRSGVTQLCSEASPCLHTTYQVPERVIGVLEENGRFFELGKLEGLYEESHYTMGLPVELKNGTRIGYIFVSTSAGELTSFFIEMLKMFLLSALAALLIAFVVTYYATGRMIRPLRQMAKVARKFGQGDFSTRVEVNTVCGEDEISQLAVAFNNMAQSLSVLESSRRSFVANVSHELKTPMTSIAGFVDGILDGTIPQERSRYYLQIVSDETKRLSRLVRSMLDVSKLQDQGGIPEDKKVHFDMEEAVGQVLITFEKKITDKRLEVDVEMPEHPVFTFASQDMVTQVIYNLIDNAVKFCPDGGTLGLKIKEGGSKIYISVSNEGETIPPEELPLVFDRFHKTDKSRSQNRDGWGLGLYIVKTIVCSHGENISVSSRDGKTEFTFTMPLVN